jgi:transcriptional regulator with XRE-family HTH domain
MVRAEDKPLAVSIGARARAFREERKATQDQVAEWVGLAAQVYARLERGEMLPSLGTLVRLSTAFAVSPAEFFLDFAGPVLREPASTYGTKPSASQKRSKRLPDISESFTHLDHATQALVLALVRHLARQRKR